MESHDSSNTTADSNDIREGLFRIFNINILDAKICKGKQNDIAWLLSQT